MVAQVIETILWNICWLWALWKSLSWCFPPILLASISKSNVLLITVGSPIEVEQDPNPSQEVVDKYHALYMEQLSDLFDQHKENYGVSKDVKLTFNWQFRKTGLWSELKSHNMQWRALPQILPLNTNSTCGSWMTVEDVANSADFHLWKVWDMVCEFVIVEVESWWHCPSLMIWLHVTFTCIVTQLFDVNIW